MNEATSENIKPVLYRSSPNPLSIPFAILLSAVLVSGAILYTGKNSGSNTAVNGSTTTNTNAAATTTPAANQTVSVSVAGTPLKGNSSAKVSLVIFEDFQCPYCEQFTTQMLPTIESKYVDSGKVSLIYEYLPLSTIHQYANITATAGACAQQQGSDQFWKMHDALFANQTTWTGAADQNAVITLIKQYASSISGLDEGKFESCLSGTIPSIIGTDSSQANTVGITGTPAFVVGSKSGDTVKGTLTVGVPADISTLESIIDKALGG